VNAFASQCEKWLLHFNGCMILWSALHFKMQL
jgi:hypothetical protein